MSYFGDGVRLAERLIGERDLERESLLGGDALLLRRREIGERLLDLKHILLDTKRNKQQNNTRGTKHP